ncbi:MAG: phosphonoacetaldehyde hydrolase [Pedosphaera sp.]|nr:phosphonoacetaldehyde hydrolase [Pedosphaera sp.]
MHLKAVIFDWAGTAVDFGSLCPINAFQAAFAARGVSVDAEDIHRFMGLRKREHIEALLVLPDIQSKWQAANQRMPQAADVDRLYKQAEKMLIETVHDFSTPTPHLIEAVAAGRSRGLKVGSCTGYTTPMMERLVPTARCKGFMPDTWVASDQVPQGRPWPWMIFKNMEELGVYPPAAVVKVGDTTADICEAINAGAWAVGVVESSSLIGRKKAELDALPPRQRNLLLHKARKQFSDAGAHFIINNMSELDDVFERIELRLEKGTPPPPMRRKKSLVSIQAAIFLI